MFTGIVTGQGRLASIEGRAEGSILTVESPELAPRLKSGDSVSVDGVCLTVVACTEREFRLEVTPETIRLTNLRAREEGDLVNLEPAARVSDFLGGHLVQGHVDGTGRLTAVRGEGNSKILRFRAARGILRYCTLKGSIAVNGISLTISALEEDWFEVTIIPHTLEVTNLGRFESSEEVNLEVDMISKYVELHVKRILVSCVLVLLASLGSLQASSLEVAGNTILIYENTTSESTSEIVIRVARYQPDIVMEWETSADQGTVQLFSRAVDRADRFTLRGLFKVGMNRVSGDETTLWLSRALYDRVVTGEPQKIILNRIALKTKLARRENIDITVDKEMASFPVVVLEDNRKGEWVFLDDRENPLLAKYSTPFYETKLSRVVNPDKISLRWIKRLPPVQ